VNALTDLDLLGLASQTVCEVCHRNTASFRYELFSTRGSITGNCCLTCFPNLLRATTDSPGSVMEQAERRENISPTQLPDDNDQTTKHSVSLPSEDGRCAKDLRS
jgi:hypothetical protein